MKERLFRSLIALLGIGVAMAGAGCIRSRVTITSDPPKAEVIFQGRNRGVTPLTIPFKWYWYYDIRLEKEGYEPLELIEHLRTPPWFITPLDLIAEILPFPISDHRYLYYVLSPAEETS